MNISVYLFGELGNGYTQYPDDYTSVIFTNFYRYAKSNTQIAIHRNGNLMYYGYVRKLEKNQYIGLCVIINGLYLPVLDKLSQFFETIISELVIKGLLIHFNEKGEIVSDVNKLHLEIEELNQVKESLIDGFKKFEPYVKSLPPINYGQEKDSCKEFTHEDRMSEIVDSSVSNGYTIIYKDKNYNSSHLNGYKRVLIRLNNDKNSLKKKYEELQEEHKKLMRKKKQFKNVVVLSLIIAGCGIGLYFLKDSLHISQEQLSHANQTIVEKEDTIVQQHSQIESQEYQINQLRYEYNNTVAQRDKLQREQNVYKTYQPFLFRSAKLDYAKCEYTVTYFGIEERTCNVRFKIIHSNSSVPTYCDRIVTISKGLNQVRCNIGVSLSTMYNYTILLIYDGVVIGGSTHG